ncbi:conserved virulence factor C family protein [Caldibacillus lycopersici]|uniref:Conserved virulence factor C family protein n=1 Tax=Perspicuibacillus lycopersici TaxID=1325689 RepID=A0AAE3IUG7_9BACI|nr:conserved virulence factor C family protein [Perspicuibacillus lycopersici]MCU9613641.1 conserved virulence factor C family protein [Perspicuibacillus lycopersici]
MKIRAIEPTPSPNTMKIILDVELPSGQRNNYRKDTVADAPKEIQQVLAVEGIKGVFHVADFIAVERHPKVDWQEILPKVRAALGQEESMADAVDKKRLDHYGEVNVFIQMFKGIPMQVKLTDGTTEKRYGLPPVFVDAIAKAQLPEDNVVLQRKWVEKGVRYGDFDQIGHDIVEEISASYPQERLHDLVELAKNPESTEIQKRYRTVTLDDLKDPDWKKRYEVLEQMAEPSVADLSVLEKALSDEKASIRRLAVVYLGMIKDPIVLPYIYQGLKDKTVTVRRTAGDCLSDLGFVEAMDEMIAALKDSSKLVRWRAAMFLYELGDERALPALKTAENDPEFEVALQIKMAIERIEGGEEAKGSVWRQMTEARNNR